MAQWRTAQEPKERRGEMSDNLATTLQTFFIALAVIAVLGGAGFFIWDNAKHMDAVREETKRTRLEQLSQRGTECIQAGGTWIEEPMVMCVYSKEAQ